MQPVLAANKPFWLLVGAAAVSQASAAAELRQLPLACLENIASFLTAPEDLIQLSGMGSNNTLNFTNKALTTFVARNAAEGTEQLVFDCVCTTSGC